MVRVCALRTNHPSTFFLMPNWMERTKSPNWWWQSLVSREKALVRRYATSDEFPSKSCDWLRTKLSFRFQKQLLSNLPLHSEFSWFTSRLRAAAAEFDELLVSLPILHIYQQVNCIFPTHTFILLSMEMLMLQRCMFSVTSLNSRRVLLARWWWSVGTIEPKERSGPRMLSGYVAALPDEVPPPSRSGDRFCNKQGRKDDADQTWRCWSQNRSKWRTDTGCTKEKLPSWWCFHC